MEPKQAVVVIHGIGEQIPMETLRSLIEGIGQDTYYSRPDRISGSSELRRIVVPRKRGSRPATDFYEMYWAHLMHRGRAGTGLSWALQLLRRRSTWARTPIAPAMRLIIGLLLACILGLGALIYARYDKIPFFTAPVTFVGALLILIGIVLLLRLSRTLGNFIADAARYLTPKPANIEARGEIRRQGVELLRRLHESGEYQRIVVIGHSLGSVIGYDILRNYWDEARIPDPQRAGAQPEAKGWGATVEALVDDSPGNKVEAFQQAQHRLWREQRARGVPWLVTDFITLGSPLTHARMLLTTKHSTLERFIADGEYPTCPPQGDESQKNHPGFYRETFSVGEDPKEKRSFLVGDPDAVFASTRWSNFYFPVHHVLFGDLVGGPMTPLFGPGIDDLPVRRTLRSRFKALRRSVFPAPHSAYWLPSQEDPDLTREERRERNRLLGTRESTPTLIRKIDLETERAKEPYPPPEPRRGA